jgi:hypothetical protein
MASREFFAASREAEWDERIWALSTRAKHEKNVTLGRLDPTGEMRKNVKIGTCCARSSLPGRFDSAI